MLLWLCFAHKHRLQIQVQQGTLENKAELFKVTIRTTQLFVSIKVITYLSHIFENMKTHFVFLDCSFVFLISAEV